MTFLSLPWSTRFLFYILSPALERKGVIECLWWATGFQSSSNHYSHEVAIPYFYGKQLLPFGHSSIQTTCYAQSLCSDSLVYTLNFEGHTPWKVNMSNFLNEWILLFYIFLAHTYRCVYLPAWLHFSLKNIHDLSPNLFHKLLKFSILLIALIKHVQITSWCSAFLS